MTSITARNYKQLGMESIPLYFNHGRRLAAIHRRRRRRGRGVRVPVAALVVAEQLPDGDPQKPLALAYQKAYRDAYKEPISTFGGHAYDSLIIAIEAIKRAGGPDHAKMRDEIEKTKGFNGIDGIFNMSPTDHLGLTLESFKMVEVRNNGWKLLY
ncbi:MAG: ABC transporter substrate-binding protein [Pseudomonadota bacterium]